MLLALERKDTDSPCRKAIQRGGRKSLRTSGWEEKRVSAAAFYELAVCRPDGAGDVALFPTSEAAAGGRRLALPSYATAIFCVRVVDNLLPTQPKAHRPNLIQNSPPLFFMDKTTYI